MISLLKLIFQGAEAKKFNLFVCNNNCFSVYEETAGLTVKDPVLRTHKVFMEGHSFTWLPSWKSLTIRFTNVVVLFFAASFS